MPSLPNGLFGVGIPFNSEMRHALYPKEESLPEYIEHVLRVLTPDWSYTWGPEKFGTFSRHYVTINPVAGARAMDALGLWPVTKQNHNGQTWLVGTEPNGWEYGNLSVEEFMEFLNECYMAFMSCRSAGLNDFAFLTPNSNINKVNMDWLRRTWIAIRSTALAPLLGVHVLGRWQDGMQIHWDGLLNWLRMIGEKKLYVTKAGPGEDISDADHAVWMAEAERRMFGAPELRGMAVTAATHTWSGKSWGGLLDERGELTAFGQAWMAARSRRRDANG